MNHKIDSIRNCQMSVTYYPKHLVEQIGHKFIIKFTPRINRIYLLLQ
jgi:hypothetical protein